MAPRSRQAAEACRIARSGGLIGLSSIVLLSPWGTWPLTGIPIRPDSELANPPFAAMDLWRLDADI
jgi:hypothetical protein